MMPWERVWAKARSSQAREQAKVKNPVIMLRVSPARQVANFPSSIRLGGPHGPLGPVCSRQNLSVSLHNLPQRKTRCWRADTVEGDLRSGRACRPETHLLIATALG